MPRLQQLIYVGDPMCSWCWGFAPELRRLRRSLPGGVRLSLCMGNLRNGHSWDDAFKTYLRRHWAEVAQRTGQPFDTVLLEQEQFDYTTEPACRAVCTARAIDPERVFDFFESLQRTFYAEGRDITDARLLCDLAAASGYDAERFAALFASPTMYEQVDSDRHRARAYGASSFPSLVAIDSEGHLSVLRGYRTCEALQKMLGL